jgi:ATP-dependent DNA helicase RecQ
LATWWGKSLTFQLPALISAEVWSLSIVISPLQSLMKDQVDSLNKKDIQNVWFLNGLLNPLERKEVIEQIETGWVDILYVSPEMLRSRSTLRILEWRNIDRIIIDEAHCFSKWWHDFRPDYLFIWDFIKALGEKNHSIKDEDWNYRVKISCFTATAKEEVTAEIKSYFKDNLWVELKEYVSTVKRNNLHYSVYKFENESEKKEKLISILKDEIITKDDDQSCIIFARTRRRTKELCEFINQEFNDEVALFYHW